MRGSRKYFSFYRRAHGGQQGAPNYVARYGHASDERSPVASANVFPLERTRDVLLGVGCLAAAPLFVLMGLVDLPGDQRPLTSEIALFFVAPGLVVSGGIFLWCNLRHPWFARIDEVGIAVLGGETVPFEAIERAGMWRDRFAIEHKKPSAETHPEDVRWTTAEAKLSVRPIGELLTELSQRGVTIGGGVLEPAEQPAGAPRYWVDKPEPGAPWPRVPETQRPDAAGANAPEWFRSTRWPTPHVPEPNSPAPDRATVSAAARELMRIVARLLLLYVVAGPALFGLFMAAGAESGDAVREAAGCLVLVLGFATLGEVFREHDSWVLFSMAGLLMATVLPVGLALLGAL